MFNGPGEQINYVPMAMSLNQAGGGWYAMEQEIKSELRGGNPPPPAPKPVDIEINISYAANKRPVGFQVTFWATEPNGTIREEGRQFRNQ
jgi:hypothetical protein